MNPSGFRLPLILTLVALILGFFCHFPISAESDIFFHLRIGDEMLRTGSIVMNDFWSNTGEHHPWTNHEWLSCLLEALFRRLTGGGNDFLPTLRAVLVFAQLALVGKVVERSIPVTISGAIPDATLAKKGAYAAGILLIFLLFITQRFQMRPELFVMPLFCALILILLRATSSRMILLLSLPLLLLWVSLHAGTAPFGLLLVASAVLLDRRFGLWPLWLKFLGAGMTLLLWLATPFGIRNIQTALFTARIDSGNLTRNPDLLPLSWEALADPGMGMMLWAWILAMVLLLGIYLWVYRTRRQSLPRPYDQPLWFGLCFLVFSVVTFAKVRARAYPLIFGLPVLSVGFSLSVAWAEKILKPRLLVLAQAFCVILGVYLVSLHIPRFYGDFGFGYEEKIYPRGAVQFIRDLNPQPVGRLVNDMNFGCYLVDQLPAFPVSEANSGDTPETYFNERNSAIAHPENYAAFLQKYDFQLALESSPYGSFFGIGVGGPVEHDRLYPRSAWALVYFDDLSVLYVKRSPQNERLIAEREYHLLFRNGVPPDYPKRAKLDADATARFYSEVERCLKVSPTNRYCLYAVKMKSS